MVIVCIILVSCKSKEEKESTPSAEKALVENKAVNKESTKQPSELINSEHAEKDENIKKSGEDSSSNLPEGAVDRDKLAKCYEEIYCAQKANDMEKIVDIYKKYGFEKPEKFSKIWIKMAKDKEWMEKVIKEIPTKCPETKEEK